MPPTLLLIDIQNDYFDGGAMPLVNSQQALSQAHQLLTHWRQHKRPVVHLQHLATRPGATFFRPGTPGADIHPTLQPEPGETVFQKNFPNGFRQTPLLEHLRVLGTESLVIAGMMTHLCVDTTTRAAADLGFACTLVHDACATRDLRFEGVDVPAQQVQAAYMAALGPSFAQVVATQSLLSAG